MTEETLPSGYVKDMSAASELMQRSTLEIGGAFHLVDHFTTFFARWVRRKSDREDSVVVQLFPRNGEEDQYYEGYVKPNCGGCGRPLIEVPMPRGGKKKRCLACERRGSVGRVVRVPGRLEFTPDVEFHESTAGHVIGAADVVWRGDIEGPVYQDELRAFALKFVDVGDVGEDIVDEFLKELDRRMDASSTSASLQEG